MKKKKPIDPNAKIRRTIYYRNYGEWLQFKKFCRLNGFSLTTGLKHFTRQAMKAQNFKFNLEKINNLKLNLWKA